MRIGTASGGEHLWFRVEGQYHNRVNYLAPGIDIRADGGLVLLPGAANADGVPYTLLDDLPLAPAHPKFLAGLNIYVPPADHERRSLPLVELDGPGAIDRARHYLEHEAPAAIQGAGGNTTTYTVAARLKDLGVSELMAADLMLGPWNERCSPPWPTDELAVVVGNAYRYGRSRPGSAAPEAQFSALPEVIEAEPRLELPETLAHRGDVVIAWDDGEDWDNEPDPLVDGLINRGEVGFLYGSPGAGKSFLALRLSHSVASGKPFGHRFTAQGGVLYEMGEAHGGAKKRKAAARKILGEHPLPIHFVLTNLNLLQKGAEQILRHCEGFKDAFGQLPALIVLDTMAALAPGFSENDADHATKLLHRLRQLSTVTGATILVLAHQGKDQARGLRGSSALLGAADFVLHADKVKMMLSVEKLREDEIPQPLGYELQAVEVGRRRDGRVIRSAVANILAKPKKNLAVIEAEMKTEQRELFRLFCSLLEDCSDPSKGIPIKELAQAARASSLIDASSDKDAIDSVRSRMKRLAKLGVVKNAGDLWSRAEDEKEPMT